MRVLLRLVSPLLGLLVAVVGLAVVVETAVAWARPESAPLVVPWPAWLATTETLTWDSGWVRTIAIVVGIVALFVVLLGLAARRHDVYLADPVAEVTVTTSSRSLARAVGHEVRSHDDVVSASVVASPKKIVVKAATLEDGRDVRGAVRERVDALLTRLPLARRPKVSVSVSVTKGVK